MEVLTFGIELNEIGICIGALNEAVFTLKGMNPSPNTIFPC